MAARFIYLNKTCYNGLYRVNKSGRFNVPIGSYSNPAICDADNLLAASDVLKKAIIGSHPFGGINPSVGDVVYCDPPYDNTFTGYTDHGFNESDQKELRDACVRWRDAGVHVIVSNSDTELIRSLYRDFRLVEVKAARNINCKANGRDKVPELLIVGQ